MVKRILVAKKASKTVNSRKKAVTNQRFGAHLSIAGGLDTAFERAESAGCDCLQIFVKNQRQWIGKAMTDDDVSRFEAARNRTGIAPVIAHASYLINLGAPGDPTAKKSVDALVDELERCERLGLAGLVLHPGAHVGEGEEAGLSRIIKRIDEVCASTSGFNTRILLETTAGQGTNLGYRFDHLQQIMEGARDASRLGVCLDTCHLFAAGYDLTTEDGYAAMAEELDATIGFDSVACIHVNDSQRACGSRVDRHDHIGLGAMGDDAFKRILNDKRLTHAPRILETPKGETDDGEDWDVVNLARLRSLLNRNRGKQKQGSTRSKLQ